METKSSFPHTEYEVVQTIATLTAVQRADWDALSATFAVEFATAGGKPIFLGFSPEAITSLIAHLQDALNKRPDIASV